MIIIAQDSINSKLFTAACRIASWMGKFLGAAVFI